jgi:hypothetical protein
MKTRLILLVLAVYAAVLLFPANPMLSVGLLFLIACTLYPTPRGRLNIGPTLSVPEILQDILEAFKLPIPEIFGVNGFATDFSSQTAVLGDKITAHIDTLPTIATYANQANNAVNGFQGFYNGLQDVENIIQDVPVTLNNFKHVPIRVRWLSQLSSKIPLYKRAIANIAYVLGKAVVDSALALATQANFSNKIVIGPSNVSLDSMENIRSQLNLQKTLNKPRWGLMTTPFASQLETDDRVKSSLFYGALNGDEGYRVFKNMAGFTWVREYPDLSLVGNNVTAVFSDPRGFVVATRKPDFSNVAEQLGCPEIMRFYPLSDPESGLNAIGVMWQEPGTGDVITTIAILWGISAGNQGGAAGTITDNATVLVTSQ